MARRIGFIGYDNLTLLDLAGPLEVFDMSNGRVEGAYETVILSPSGRPFRSESSVTIVPGASLERSPRLDTVFVPGGAGLRDPAIAAPIVQWLRRHAPRIRRIASVCTGVYALAETGL